jgi:6-phosphogluconolactonase (cycloisomerase 2 family)
MNKIIFFAKLSLDALRDTKKIIKYFNLLKKNSLLDDLFPKNLKKEVSVNGYRSRNIILNPTTGIFYTMTELTELYSVSKKNISRLIKNGKTVDKLKEMFIVV